MNLGFAGKGNASQAGGAGRAGRGGRLRAQAARGLGHDAGRDRLLPLGRRRLRRAGDDPHRHAQRIGLRRGHDQGVQGPHHPRLPHRRRGRRPRARHHPGRRARQRAAVLDQSDAALHPQHARRTSRHADGLPSSRQRDPRGPRLRREPHPQGDDRGRRHPARSRRALDDVERQPGDGPGRRSDHPHLADRRQDEAPARRARGRRRAATTISAPSATSPNIRSTRRSPMACRSTSARSRRASSPISCCGRRRSSA